MLLKVVKSLGAKRFKELVREWWTGYSVAGSNNHCLVKKLKALKRDLRRWNKEVFEAQMGDLEEYKNYVLMEETSWRQKSRETWLKKGDKNTRAYQTLLLENQDWRQRIEDLQFHVMGTKRSRSLEVPFLEEEVFEALCSLSNDKTSSIDGFTMAFWQFSWEFTKDEIMALFWRGKGGVEELKDFRSISLVGSLYELLAKVLENRLKLAVREVVSKFQHAFIQDRQILDVALIANEAIHSKLKSWRLSASCCSEPEMGVSSRGLRDKSEVILVGRIDSLENIVLMMGCRVGKLPTSYLGLPLGAPFKSSRVWDVVEERFKKCLVLVEEATISLRGERKEVGVREKRGEPMVWECGKLLEKIGKSIRSRPVGNGKKVKFWKDLWCEDQTLKDDFPNLFMLAVNKDEWVFDAWEESGEVGS
ncbi:hypothetical protein CK203_074683 [Vitis vinifera]|uniref:Reverse transcriptase domain-containing protein n=1 Tax=Vitis vinifera TaxID=29760 RepID=A0A438DWE9_VITVI|nr:hypothetical protein CK203_074683 [Vitis vinifera]